MAIKIRDNDETYNLDAFISAVAKFNVMKPNTNTYIFYKDCFKKKDGLILSLIRLKSLICKIYKKYIIKYQKHIPVAPKRLVEVYFLGNNGGQ